MTSSPDDKTFEQYLERDSAVSQQYRNLDADDVPANVDSAVLAQARAAVSKPSRQSSTQQKPAWLRWGPPLALAASAVMVVAIVLEVGVQDEIRMPAGVTEQAASSPAEIATMTTESEQRDLQLTAADAASESSPTAVTAPAPAAPPAVEPKASTRPLMDAPALETPRIAAVPAPSTKLHTDGRQPQVVSPPAPVAQKSVVRQSTSVETFANAASTSSSSGERREAEEMQAEPARARSRGERAEEVIVTANPVRPLLEEPQFGPRATGAPVSAQGREVDEEARQRAEQWLIAIRRLRVDGKDAEADEQWQQFSKEFPGYQIERTDLALPRSQREPPP